jgi:diguanylate cyclase (GGDEF)-like protein/PAS domain S-box-containing protein
MKLDRNPVTPPLLRLPRSRAGRWNAAIAVFAAVLIAAIWFVTMKRVQSEYDTEVAQAFLRNANLALALEEHTVRTLRGVEQTLAHVAGQYRARGLALSIESLMDDGVVDASVAHYLGVVDERGRLVLGSGPFRPTDFSDREWFTVHKAGKHRGTYIDKPMRGRVTGEWVIPMSRRISRADGSFAGVVYTGLDPHYFTTFYQRADLGEKGLVDLVGLDGITRARRVGRETLFGRDMRTNTLFRELALRPVGRYQSLGRRDGVPRFYTYRTIAQYPLVVAVATSIDETLADYRARARRYTWVGAAWTAFILLFAGAFCALLLRQMRAVGAVAVSEAELRATFDQAPAGMAQTGLDGRFLRVNARLCEMLGRPERELKGRSFIEFTHPDDAPPSLGFMTRLLDQAAGDIPELEKRYLRRDGSAVWVQITASVIRDDQGEPSHFLSLMQDIGARKHAESALRESREQFEQLANHIPEGFWITDVSAPRREQLVYASPSFETIAGFRLGSLPEAWRTWKRAIHPEDSERVMKAYRDMRDDGVDQEFRIVRPDGTVRWVHARGFPVRDGRGEVYRVAGIVEDVTEQRTLEQRLLHQAQHDALTDLPNRVLCFDRLGQAIGQAQRRDWKVALLFIDLDRFKNVNDTLGHALGDELLRQAAARLAQCVREEDTVARLGGDEFGVILGDMTHAQDAALVAQKILERFAVPFTVGGHEAFVTASIGIASYPVDGADAATLGMNADAAMFRAKRRGRNTYEFYTTEMNALALDKLELENRLRRAIERNEFLLEYQAKTDTVTGRLAGFEALLRWRPSATELVPPSRFVPLLEDSGLIIPAGEWVLRAACAQARAWQTAGTPVPVAVNLSARQFERHDLRATVDRVLTDTGLDPALLELEITESAAMDNPEEAVRTLLELRRLGVRLAIDDFGTGYSSLAYLKRFPVDALKLDRSFVAGLPESADDASIARAVIAMAHSLKLKVIAEGVENEGQRGFLSVNGCDQIQGFLISRPVPAAECDPLLRARRQPGQYRDEPGSGRDRMAAAS